MLRRIAITLGLLLAIPLFAVPCWIATHRSDLPTPNDEDLAVQLSDLQQGENGFDDLAVAAQALDWPEDCDCDGRLRAIQAGKIWEPAWIEEMLARNARAMAALHRALIAPAMQLPIYRDAEDELLDPLYAAQRLVRLAGAEARLQLDRGDRERAIERAMVGMRLGKRVSSGEGVELVSMSFATALQGMSLADLEVVVRRIPLDAPTAGELVAQLDSARWTDEDWQRAWAAEYQHFKAGLLEPSHEELFSDSQDGTLTTRLLRLVPATYLWQPNRTLSSLSDILRTIQHRSELDCREAYALPLLEGDRRSRTARAIVSQNPLGNLMNEILSPGSITDRYDTRRCHLETKIALLRTLIGTKAYWDTHGRLPASLDDLVPRYLPDLPHDRFGGRTLAYSADREVAYSVGEDFLDAGGGDPPDPFDANEPAISLAF